DLAALLGLLALDTRRDVDDRAIDDLAAYRILVDPRRDRHPERRTLARDALGFEAFDVAVLVEQRHQLRSALFPQKHPTEEVAIFLEKSRDTAEAERARERRIRADQNTLGSDSEQAFIRAFVERSIVVARAVQIGIELRVLDRDRRLRS